jgi:4-alpha-glucanotransferase
MLICGEDLGMIPASVPGVMADLNIIPLEIQRMPKGDTKYGLPAGYPYLSVCSPSCHDMSTIRGWWENDAANANQFHQEFLGMDGPAPQKCSSSIVENINQVHLNAPSILAIFPIQDLLGMDDKLKKPDAFSEQINEPSNPDHYWRYRLHIDLEDLLNEHSFLNKIKHMVIASGRVI